MKPPRPSRTSEDKRAARASKQLRRRRNPEGGFTTFRMSELYTYFNWRYGAAPLPDDDDGRDSIKLVFQVLSTTTSPEHRMVDVARIWAPWLPADELAALVADVVAHPRRFKAGTIAARLGITAAIRKLLDLRTIGAVDESAEQRKIRRIEAHGQRTEAPRRRGTDTRPNPRAMQKPAAAMARRQGGPLDIVPPQKKRRPHPQSRRMSQCD